jgi:tetratricopeptide (TPR) repeat protein
VLQSKGDLDRALAEYDRAIGVNPKYAEALAGRGIALVLKGRAGEAMSDFDRALEVDPRNGVAFAGRALAMLASGQAERAVVAFDEAIANGSDEPFTYFGRGRAFLQKGDLDKAKADLDRAIALDAKLADAYAARGLVLMKKQDIAGARADLDRAIALDPKKIETFNVSGAIYELQGKRLLETLAGKTVALMDIGKMRGDEFLDRLEQLCRERHIATRRYKKPTNTRVAPRELIAEIAHSCDAVVIALSDCGSCTSCSTHDLNELDKRGLVGVSVLTEEFRPAFAQQISAIGFDGASVFVPHPMQNKTTAELQAFADRSVDQVLSAICTSGATPLSMRVA